MVILFPGCYYHGDAMEEVPWVEDLEEWNIAVGNCFALHGVREKQPRERTGYARHQSSHQSMTF